MWTCFRNRHLLFMSRIGQKLTRLLVFVFTIFKSLCCVINCYVPLFSQYCPYELLDLFYALSCLILMVGVSNWAWNDCILFKKKVNILKYFYSRITIFLLCFYLLWFWQLSLSILMAEDSVWSDFWTHRALLWLLIS